MKNNSIFKNYVKKEVSEMRNVTATDIETFNEFNKIPINNDFDVSISDVDLVTGSPKLGDMIARNPKNYNNQWLVEKEFFLNNYQQSN